MPVLDPPRLLRPIPYIPETIGYELPPAPTADDYDDDRAQHASTARQARQRRPLRRAQPRRGRAGRVRCRQRRIARVWEADGPGDPRGALRAPWGPRRSEGGVQRRGGGLRGGGHGAAKRVGGGAQALCRRARTRDGRGRRGTHRARTGQRDYGVQVLKRRSRGRGHGKRGLGPQSVRLEGADPPFDSSTPGTVGSDEESVYELDGRAPHPVRVGVDDAE
ncbi:hypothetical protein B0H17DRAFT_1112139 [Mycena rosella]|uniref:Uncharacterized protein n=1 Tax=Mycena rosella TaxID=1033263 RepID=A0AAD7FIU4_MYCRO|nr:hypothetical protein B0H17DRAFT_1112139 [Mycena rosella]